MATEVLLMTAVPNLGEEGDVVTVADGYARNYLLPRSLAAPVTEATRRRLVKIQKEREATRKAELQVAREKANQLATVSLTIPVKTGDDDKMYGSVTTSEILDALTEQNVELDRHAIALEQPIKELGVYDVPVKIHPEVETTLKVWVVEE